VLGGIIRLAWHDAVEYDHRTNGADGLRSDGCIDFTNPENKRMNEGLQLSIRRLEPIWLQHCEKISRADFWVLAAISAIQAACPYLITRLGDPLASTMAGAIGGNFNRRLFKGGSLHQFYVIPFKYGRIDRANCTYAASSNLNDPRRRIPHPEGGVNEIKTLVMDKFGLDAKHAVALFGAHTLGHANQSTSGYNSSWQDRADLFTITYFKLLAVLNWQRTAMMDPYNGAVISQFNVVKQPQGKNNNAFMLNTPDMAMIYNINGSSYPPMNKTCGPYATLQFVALPPSETHNTCPLTKLAYPDPKLNFSDWVLYFAEGNTESQDEPGASRWLSTFATAFTKVVETGYSPRSLTCMTCRPVGCTEKTCSDAQICETGALDTPDTIPFKPNQQLKTGPAPPDQDVHVVVSCVQLSTTTRPSPSQLNAAVNIYAALTLAPNITANVTTSCKDIGSNKGAVKNTRRERELVVKPVQTAVTFTFPNLNDAATAQVITQLNLISSLPKIQAQLAAQGISGNFTPAIDFVLPNTTSIAITKKPVATPVATPTKKKDSIDSASCASYALVWIPLLMIFIIY